MRKQNWCTSYKELGEKYIKIGKQYASFDSRNQFSMELFELLEKIASFK